MEDYKKLLTDLYKKHDPERIKQIDYFLERYKGKERQFFISQQSKYKSKKVVSDSKKIIEEALERIKSQSEGAKSKKRENNEVSKDKPKDTKKTTLPLVEKKIEKKVEIEPEKEAAKTPEPITIQTSPSPEAAEEKNETPIAAVQPPMPSKADSKKPLQEKDSSKRKKYFWSLLGIILLIILLALLVFYFFFYAPNNIKEETSAEKPQTTIIKEQAKPEVQIPDAKPTQESTAPVRSVRIEKGDLQLPTHFVACYAVKNETFAIQKVNELKEKGFDASYYWIPDFVTHGQPYFKVVIGPFATRTDAMKKLTPVQERAEFDAYVLELK